VQEMAAQKGAEFFVGVSHDPLFGPLLACGYGGTLVELIRDVAVRITPVTDTDLDEMLHGLKMWPLFEGYRGQPPLDAPALRSLLFRISAMVEDLPHIAELDLNPVLVGAKGEGCTVLDARIRIETPRPSKPLGARTT
jgi:acetate---CoA ligase (ADP-forming)